MDWEENKWDLGNNGNIFHKKDFFHKRLVSGIILLLLLSFIFFIPFLISYSFSNQMNITQLLMLWEYLFNIKQYLTESANVGTEISPPHAHLCVQVYYNIYCHVI